MKKSKRLYYIGDVSRIVEVPAHIIRYWEREFPFLKPMRDHRGHRIYTENDIRKIKKISELLHTQGYKIRGAKKKMRGSDEVTMKNSLEQRKILKKMLQEIREIKKCLK